MTKPISPQNEKKVTDNRARDDAKNKNESATISNPVLERREDADTQSEFSVSDAIKDRQN